MHAILGKRFRKLIGLVAACAVLALLGVQQGQAAHEFSHLAQGGAGGPAWDKNAPAGTAAGSAARGGVGNGAPDQNAPHSKTCDKCAFYAELSGGAPAALLAIAPAAASGKPALSGTALRFASLTLAAYAARAPPAFL